MTPSRRLTDSTVRYRSAQDIHQSAAKFRSMSKVLFLLQWKDILSWIHSAGGMLYYMGMSNKNRKIQEFREVA